MSTPSEHAIRRGLLMVQERDRIDLMIRLIGAQEMALIAKASSDYAQLRAGLAVESSAPKSADETFAECRKKGPTLVALNNRGTR